MLKFYSLNARGLRSEQKRREIFWFLKQKGFDVIFIQESHSSPEIEDKWKKEWGGEITYNHYNSRARGTMTLFKSNVLPIEHWNDKEGRTDINVVKYVYAPNTDNERSTYFDNLSSTILTKFTTQNVIMAGDFNTVLEKIDKKPGHFF